MTLSDSDEQKMKNKGTANINECFTVASTSNIVSVWHFKTSFFYHFELKCFSNWGEDQCCWSAEVLELTLFTSVHWRMSLNINSASCVSPVVANEGMCVSAVFFNSSEFTGDWEVQWEISDRIHKDRRNKLRMNRKIRERRLNHVSVISISGYQHA